MRILLISPLYPPDIAGPAAYVKELATRLSSQNTVEILTYGHIPETISNVEITALEKSSSLPIRVVRFTLTLLQMSKKFDCIYSQNGPSVEVPIFVLSFFSSKPIFMRLGDETSLQNSLKLPLLRSILNNTIRRMSAIITHSKFNVGSQQYCVERPLPRPEILPFSDFPTAAFLHFEKSWEDHISKLISIFKL
ncbi:MAG: hypothetical protein K9M10_00430 [Candidatus Pacebacteria bacterium]|nr:hypothetical protein [Candidatus Paceibacterota bacterium]MCF7856928.1 hypothetical protein [Candidatus Paceibacterota bacterium]